MDKKSKILIWVFAAFVALSASFAFYRFIVLQDFPIHTDEEAFIESL
ncbi:MAG: hypothetical protein HYS87_02040 [Candidatus Colwellbacteria bacterium]|nr:hypothetical protein [Candidatus Colwellbacteria bacterium]